MRARILTNWSGRQTACASGDAAPTTRSTSWESSCSPPAFSLPIRLFLEAKFTRRKTQLHTVRNARGVIHDINENFVSSPGQRLRKRFRYVYALFSAKGFTEDAQNFALAQQISLIDLSGASFAWLLRAVGDAAAQLHRLQEPYRVGRSTGCVASFA
jgi:hypothetical protein